MMTTHNRTIGLSLAVAILMAGGTSAVSAQAPSTPPSYDARDEQASWINDPHVHDFYKATIEAFANGPDRLDRAAYEQRSRAIFRAMAVSRNMSPDGLEQHLARIPGEMIQIVTRDPKTLASYESFIVALFGPQKPGAIKPAS